LCSIGDALTWQAEKEGATLTIITLGPLTNLALALALDKNLVGRVGRLVAMMGCGNGRGNATRVAEFNAWCDPEATARVLRGGWAVEVVSWELCQAFPIPWEPFDQALASDGTHNRFLSKILDKAFVQSRAGEDPCRQKDLGAVICDALAVAVALDPTVAMVSDDVHVDMELAGVHSRGQTVVDWGCYDGVRREPNCDWVRRVDMEKYCSMITETFV
jgi:purine nucleosidase